MEQAKAPKQLSGSMTAIVFGGFLRGPPIILVHIGCRDYIRRGLATFGPIAANVSRPDRASRARQGRDQADSAHARSRSSDQVFTTRSAGMPARRACAIAMS